MRSARATPDDLTARARIRDSAIVYFGRHGFSSATVRAIATDAGVSPALVLHHFGSKDGLRAACDAHVTAQIDQAMTDASSHLSSADVLAQLAQKPDLAPLASYLATALLEGGEFADRLFERIVSDTEAYQRSAVAAGVARPADDERLRAEMLTVFSLGAQLLARYVLPPGAPAETASTAVAERLALPVLELFTHGFYTTSEYLDAYRAQQANGAAPERARGVTVAEEGESP